MAVCWCCNGQLRGAGAGVIDERAVEADRPDVDPVGPAKGPHQVVPGDGLDERAAGRAVAPTVEEDRRAAMDDMAPRLLVADQPGKIVT